MHPTFRGSAEGETHSKSDAVAKGTHAVRVTRSESDAVTQSEWLALRTMQ